MTKYSQVIYALLAEFVGTFVLVLFTACAFSLTSAQGGNLVVSALTAGAVLAVAFYIFNRWSGAHLNPIVSFAFAFAGQMNWLLMLGYWIMQFVGAIAGGALALAFYPASQSSGSMNGSLVAQDNPWKAVLVAAFMAFLLVFAYLQFYRDSSMGMFTGLALGAVYAAIVFATGYLVGGSAVNPAQALGIGIFYNLLSTVWVPFLGGFIGSIVGVFVYKLMNMDPSAKMARDSCGKQLYDECGKPLIVVEHTEVDKCGKEVKGDCNKGRVSRWLMVKPEYGFRQATAMSSLVDMAKQMGFNAQHLIEKSVKVYTDRNATVASEQNLVELLQEANTIPQSAKMAAGAETPSTMLSRASRMTGLTSSSPRRINREGIRASLYEM